MLRIPICNWYGVPPHQTHQNMYPCRYYLYSPSLVKNSTILHVQLSSLNWLERKLTSTRYRSSYPEEFSYLENTGLYTVETVSLLQDLYSTWVTRIMAWYAFHIQYSAWVTIRINLFRIAIHRIWYGAWPGYCLVKRRTK
jgi:hypothetical protein